MKQKNTHVSVYGIDEIEKMANYLYSLKDQCDIYTFTGSLGAGKTTLVQQLLQCYGVVGTITSPTFTYVQIYQGQAGQTLYHFDLYRLQSANDFIQAGFDEYLYKPNSLCFIEWPEIIEPLLGGKRVCHVSLDYYGLEERQMTCYIQYHTN